MRRFLLFGLLGCLCIGVSGQVELIPTGTPGWFEVEAGQGQNSQDAIHLLRTHLGLNEGWTFTLLSSDSDETGLSWDRFTASWQGIPVDYARIHLYFRQGEWIRVHTFLPDIKGVPGASVSAQAAINTAVSHVGAVSYYWEVPALEAMRKEITGDPAATYAPQPELVWANETFDWDSDQYRLAWKMDIMAAEPLDSRLVYVDASSGEVFKELSLIHREHVPGTTTTMYRGTQPIVSDSVNPGEVRLHDYSRAALGIVTMNLQNQTQLSQGVDFTNDSRHWDLTNSAWDHASGDVHWGSELAYDMYFQKFGFDSYDGNGGQIRSFVHFGDTTYANAFWNVDHAGYGDDLGSPHVGIDIVGHEVTHGVVRNTANLIYIDEGGALNEGFADIFGNTLEAMTDSSLASWDIGENSSSSRSMANPRSIVYGPSSEGHPDTYQGDGWYEGPFDNGGAHGNATVFGHWYYLLTEGGAGTNDLGNAYQVQGIGIDKAAQIAWRTLAVYLMPTSGFHDARVGSISAAEDLYGLCSSEWQAVVNAWHAVGIGEPVRDNDIGMIAVEAIPACELDPQTPIIARLKNFGCSTTASGSFQVIYTLKNPLTVGLEVLTLPNGLAPGETVTVSFSQLLDLSAPADYAITATSLYPGDSYQANNESPASLVPARIPLSDLPLSMESMPAADTVSITSGTEAHAAIEAGIGADGGHAIRFAGGNGHKYRLVEAFPMWGGPPVDMFDYNPDFGAQACMCLPAGGPHTLIFDRRQTFSTHFGDEFEAQFPMLDKDSLMSRQGSMLRVLMNGEEIARYFPLTPDQDPWTTETLPLPPGDGNPAQVCFESRTIWSTHQDPLQVGDQVFLDNISLQTPATDLDDQPVVPGVSVWYQANPQFADQLRLTGLPIGSWTMRVMDVHGRPVWQQQLESGGGDQSLDLPDSLPGGMYLIGVLGQDHQQWIRWLVSS